MVYRLMMSSLLHQLRNPNLVSTYPTSKGFLQAKEVNEIKLRILFSMHETAVFITGDELRKLEWERDGKYRLSCT